MHSHSSWLAAGLLTLALVGCGDSNNRNDGGVIPPPANTTEVDVELNAAQVISGSSDIGSAAAHLTINLDDNTISGTVTLNGLSAETVSVKQGFAGEEGPVLFAFAETTPTEWTIADLAFTQADLDALNVGGLYVDVTTANQPDGAVRGQITMADIKVYFPVLTGAQEVPEVDTNATARGAVTLNASSGALVVHVNTSDLDDAVAAHIHQALAGTNGGILVELVQDSSLASHWFAEDAVLDGAGSSAFDSGALYVNVHTPDHPAGEVRGQIQPQGIEVVFTRLAGGDMVPSIATANSGVAATTIKTAGQVITTYVNLLGMNDALAVKLKQAPVGQNGPTIFALAQNPNEVSQWSLLDQALTAAQYSALRNQGLYLTAETPAFPAGEVRGQLRPEMSAPGGAATFVVSSVTPSNGAMIDALPASIVATFNRSLLTDSASTASAALLASGGDGAFGDAQDLAVAIAGVSVSGDRLTIDLSGAPDMDDVYQLTLDGTSAAPITDAEGVVMDGDNDGNAGGDFVSTFTVSTPTATPTLNQVQAETFTVSCAVSGCHAGPTPAQGMNLSAGQAFSNIVNVPSVENPALDRVEPGDPDNSYLVRKIEGTAGTRMPLGQPALPNQQIQNIRNWILDGAQDN